MASSRHVSRWRLCRPPQACNSGETSPSSDTDVSPPVATVSASTPPVSLRYLNEFVGKLHCAPALLQHGLFPDAKEVTESMALFNAVRRYIEPKSNGEELQNSEKHDGIVVVGDGNTPRTAAMFAFRMRGWKCYSVDPAMEKGTSERSKGWADVANLVVVRNKIENVRIALRRAIVVLVHAHVTLDQALSAVQAEQVCGVVTLPCCNWYGKQEVLFGRGPDLVYDDFSVLSDHREIRLWVGGKSVVNTSHADLSLASSVMKGCVRKEMIEKIEKMPGERAEADTNEKQMKDLRKRYDGVLDFIGDTVGELVRDVSSMTQEEYMAEEQTIGSSLPSAVASHLETDTHVLALGWHPRRMAVRLLLRGGYTNVYTISLSEELSFSVIDSGERGIKRLKLQLHKCTIDLGAEPNGENDEEETIKIDPCGFFTLQSSFALSSTGEEEEPEEEKITVSFEKEGSLAPALACVLDAGFIFRGFRGRAKKNPTFFRLLCRTLDQLVSACGSSAVSQSASLVCLTPRKQWRKKEFLTHQDLGYDVLSLIATRKQFPGTPVYVYCCFKQQTLPSLAATAATEQPSGVEPSSASTVARDAAIETWLQLQTNLNKRRSELGDKLVVMNSPDTRLKAAQDQEQAVTDNAADPRKVYIQATGEISRVRRFSNGLAFVSLELAGSGYDSPLQVFLQRDTLDWSPDMFAKVVSLLRKGDELVAVGFMARNARGHSMLQVETLSLARTGEYEAYN
ncbi:Nucleic acid-binding, OB-fold [Phytophthora cinnamomi]|uniref:Nucleic acid-binding, OB-fold n=1 Tax=Phytophthora cinnamomi TaxID=4785 RepID=UPI0035594380|nr:Nucleic acid-binding, OB-fold [Phytophthora cinnamomi]